MLITPCQVSSNPLDFFSGERKLFGLQIFLHMLRVRRAGQGQHPDLHRKPKNDLRDAGAQSIGNAPHLRLSQYLPLGGQQRKSLVDDAVRPADVSYIFIPSERGVTAVLHHHGFMLCLRAKRSELFGCDIADADHAGFA